jgi:uncharacterized cupin superfamily protein
VTDGQVLHSGEGKVIALPGITAVFKALSDRAAGDHIVVELTAEPGVANHRAHLHRTHEELFYILDGEFDFLVGDRVARLGAGSFVNVPPGVLHDFRNPGQVPARFLAVASPGGLDRYFDEILELVRSGTFNDTTMRELRLRYDTEEPDQLPPDHWSHAAPGTG